MRNADAFNAGKEGDLLGLVGEVEGLVDAFAAKMRELDGERLTGHDESGHVTATVSGSGRLLGVDIGAKAMRDLDHLALARAVQDAIATARAAMAEGLEEAVKELTGGLPQQGEDPLNAYFDAVLGDEHG